MSKLHSGASKTKAGQGGLARVALFWKSHCATCSPVYLILCHVTGSCKGPISATLETSNISTVAESKAYLTPGRVGGEYGYSVVLVINRVWIWPFWSEIGYGFCTSLELGMFLRRSYFFVINDKTINKSRSKIIFRATALAATVINRISYFWSGHK